ncbi:MAG: AraC family transcriptional regulator ligand-binding domain-containing protein [Pseudomonadota bacterium]
MARYFQMHFIERMISQLCEEEGFEPALVLEGVDLTPEELFNPQAQIELSLDLQLHEKAVAMSTSPGFGLRSPASQNFFDQGPVVPLMMACETVGEAFLKLQEYNSGTNPYAQYNFFVEGDELIMQVENPIQVSPQLHVFLTEQAFAVWRFLNVPLHEMYTYGKRIFCDFPEPEHVWMYRTLFDQPFEFNAGFDGASMPLSVVETKLPHFHPQAREHLEQECKLLMDKLRQPPTTGMLRKYLEDTPPRDWNFARFAQTTALSERSLRRRLRAEATNFNHELLRKRSSLATYYASRGMSEKEVAYELGYASTKSMRRALQSFDMVV